jgi:lipid-binding SYLF domain-containing protein
VTCFSRHLGVLTALPLAILAAVGVGCGPKTQPEAGQKQVHPSDTAAGQMIELGRTKSMGLLNNKQAEGIRNIIGGASGIFIAPNLGGGSLIVGVDAGTGFLMRRHGLQWSDPVFYSLTQTSAGFQIGVKNAHVIVLLMTDTAMKEFTSGNMKIGGSGGITVGTYGISVSGAGALDSGLELLIISSSQGIAIGGGLATIDPTPARELNQQAYGPDPDPRTILSIPGGRYVPAAALRDDLTAIVSKAWGLPKILATTRPAPPTSTTEPLK